MLKCFVVGLTLDVVVSNAFVAFFSLHIFLNIFSQNFFLIKNHLDSFVRSLAAPDGCELGTRSIFKKNKINFLIDKTKTLEASPKVMIKETILIFYPLLERSVCVVEKHLLNWSPPFLQRPGENLASQSKISPGQKMPPLSPIWLSSSRFHDWFCFRKICEYIIFENAKNKRNVIFEAEKIPYYYWKEKAMQFLIDLHFFQNKKEERESENIYAKIKV